MMAGSQQKQKMAMKKKQKCISNHQSIQKQYDKLLKNISNLNRLQNSKKQLILPKINKMHQKQLSIEHQSPSLNKTSLEPLDTTWNSNIIQNRIQNESINISIIQNNDTNFIELINDDILRKTSHQMDEKMNNNQCYTQVKIKKNQKQNKVTPSQKFQLKQYYQLIKRFKNKVNQEISSLSINILDNLNRRQIKSVLLQQELKAVRQEQIKQQARKQQQRIRRLKQIADRYDKIKQNCIPNELIKILPRTKQYKSEEKRTQRLSTACRNKVKKLLQIHIRNIMVSKNYDILPSIR